MAEVLYPIGYGTRMGTIDEVMAYMRPGDIEPEYGERIKLWFISRGGVIGPGGAMRFVQPIRPGFADPGKSFHERQTFNDGAFKYMACDLVHVNPGAKHRAPTWAEVPRQGSGHPDISKYGVHCNVDGEPWHMQCVEVDGWATWVKQLRQHPNPNFILPTTPQPPVVTPPTPVSPVTPPPTIPPVTVPVPPGSYTMPPLSSIALGANNNQAHVQVWQQMMNRWFLWWGFGTVEPNGIFDEHNRDATILFQTRIQGEGRQSAVDGSVGPQSWANVFSDC